MLVFNHTKSLSHMEGLPNLHAEHEKTDFVLKEMKLKMLLEKCQMSYFSSGFGIIRFRVSFYFPLFTNKVCFHSVRHRKDLQNEV